MGMLTDYVTPILNSCLHRLRLNLLEKHGRVFNLHFELINPYVKLGGYILMLVAMPTMMYSVTKHLIPEKSNMFTQRGALGLPPEI